MAVTEYVRELYLYFETRQRTSLLNMSGKNKLKHQCISLQVLMTVRSRALNDYEIGKPTNQLKRK